ncbi:hypothetical protein [Streptomyces coeruleorubidus]|uniref:hypothetical protein n=1 Tax=Streptomyces coeruleorubidus TaxID=116188 RepID=UPI00365F4B60
MVLLVGGMLVIGLLCGERAYAADGVRALTDSTVGRVVDEQSPSARPDAHVLAGRGRPDAHAPEPRQRPTAHASAGWIDSRDPRSVSGVDGVPLAGVDARTTGERVVRVAGDTGEAVPEGLGEARAKGSSSSSSLPLPRLPVLSELPAPSDPPAAPKPPKPQTLPDLSNLPALPDLPVLPELPGLPDLPNLPGPSDLLPPPPAPPTGEVTLPEAPGLPGHPSCPALPGHPLPAPVTADPQPDRKAPSPADRPASVGRAAGAEFAAAGSDTVVRGAEHHADGWTGHASHTGPADRTRPAHHDGPSVHAGHGPGGHAPAGRPDHVLGNRTTADNGPSRHGDPQAVTLSHRAPLRFLPGVAARSRAADARNGHQDIPVFPG